MQVSSSVIKICDYYTIQLESHLTFLEPYILRVRLTSFYHKVVAIVWFELILLNKSERKSCRMYFQGQPFRYESQPCP